MRARAEAPDAARDAAAIDRSRHAGLELFGVMWALASVWHLLGNTPTAPGWSQALVALAAGAVLWRPGWVAPLACLAGADLLTAWAEAPVIGNHWVLASFVNVAILGAVLTTVVRGRGTSGGEVATRLFPVARLCLLGFYSFAAFAKLNSAFFDRSVSCAVVYFQESTSSIGVSGLQLGGTAWLQWVVIIGTLAVELSVPVLLLLRRTRHLGVVVGLVFHGLLAVDHHHEFFDFSAVLAALFVLFLPASAGTWVAERVGSARARLALADRRLPSLVHAGLTALPVLAGLAVAFDVVGIRGALDLGWWPWQAWAVLSVLAALRFLDQRPPTPARGALRPHHLAFLILPVLVVANGLTPYLELKTGFGWNMYANLRTVDGDSNHLLVRRTLPLTDIQADLVRIIHTNDPGLASYEAHHYALTWFELRIYLADHPTVGLTYERHGAVVSVAHARDRPELVQPVPTWRQKVQLFRAVDLESPERCVPTFGPAR